LQSRDFDVAISHQMKVDHGTTIPLLKLTGALARYDVLPIFVNCAAAPLPRFARVRALGEAIGRLAFTPVRGMVRGFMDLVFCHNGRYYIADWKSNHLGGRLEDYGGERLAAEMDRRLYQLQYLLYTVALHNFLAARLPGYDYASYFGGVYYLFLRGIDQAAGPSHGIFRDRPPQGLIEELSAALVEFGART